MEYIVKAEDIFRGKSVPMIPIDFNMTGKCAGQHKYTCRRNWTTGRHEYYNHTLRFNRVLMNENPKEYLENVVPHEVAHYIVSFMYPKTQSHGREWKDMMTMVMDRPATTRHNMDTTNSRRKVKRHVYRCSCQEHVISTVKHNRILRNHTTYRCKYCKTAIHQ